MDVQLQHPITFEGARVDVVRVRRPKVRDLEAIDRIQGDMARAVRLAANLCELSPEAVRELDAADFARIQEVIAGFLGDASPTSTT